MRGIIEHCNKEWKSPETLSEKILEDLHIEDIEYIRKLYKMEWVHRIIMGIEFIIIWVLLIIMAID